MSPLSISMVVTQPHRRDELSNRRVWVTGTMANKIWCPTVTGLIKSVIIASVSARWFYKHRYMLSGRALRVVIFKVMFAPQKTLTHIVLCRVWSICRWAETSGIWIKLLAQNISKTTDKHSTGQLGELVAREQNRLQCNKKRLQILHTCNRHLQQSCKPLFVMHQRRACHSCHENKPSSSLLSFIYLILKPS